MWIRPQPTRAGRSSPTGKRFKESYGKTVGAVVETGKLIIEAKEALGASFSELEAHLEEELRFSSSVLSMFSTIAANAVIQNPENWCHLPNGYNTLYHLTQIEEAKFAELIKTGKVTPRTTLAEAKAFKTVVPFKKKDDTQRDEGEIPSILRLEDPSKQSELLEKLDELLGSYGATVADADGEGVVAKLRKQSLLEKALAEIEATKGQLQQCTVEQMRMLEKAAGELKSHKNLPDEYPDYATISALMGEEDITRNSFKKWIKENKVPNQMGDLARIQDAVYVWEQVRLVAQDEDRKGALKRLRELAEKADNLDIKTLAKNALERIYGFLPKEAKRDKADQDQRAAA